MIERAVLETIRRKDLERRGGLSEPEQRGIEQVRSKIGKDAGPLVAPRRIAHEARGSVSVKHPEIVDPTQLSRVDRLLHPHEMRLESVVVRGVANRLIRPRE